MRWSHWRQANYAFFKDKLPEGSKELKLIDLGAGELQFKDLFYQFDYTGVDFKEFEGVEVVADLTKAIPLPGSSADILTLSNVLEHIPNTEFFLKECRRLLKKDGLLIGTIPFLLPEHQVPYDFNRYTHFQLTRLLKEAGFTRVSVQPLGSQIDVYETIERKVFDELYLFKSTPLLKVVRVWRQLEMALIRRLFAHVPATFKVTEGYGFYAV